MAGTQAGVARSELLRTARALGPAFAERASQYDREAAFPFENYAELREAGFLGLCIPARYGGLGASFADYMHVAAELARFCPMTALTFNMHSQTVLWTGHRGRRPRPLRRPTASGTSARARRSTAASWRTARSTPSRCRRASRAGPRPGSRRRAEPTEGGWLVSGKKIFASLAGAASAYNLTCVVPGEDVDPLPLRAQRRAGRAHRRRVGPARHARHGLAHPALRGRLRPARRRAPAARRATTSSRALALRLPDPDADVHGPHARRRRLRAGLPRRRRARRASPPAATCRRSSRAGRRSRSCTSAAARSGRPPWPRPASTPRPMRCDARGPRTTR